MRKGPRRKRDVEAAVDQGKTKLRQTDARERRNGSKAWQTTDEDKDKEKNGKKGVERELVLLCEVVEKRGMRAGDDQQRGLLGGTVAHGIAGLALVIPCLRASPRLSCPSSLRRLSSYYCIVIHSIPVGHPVCSAGQGFLPGLCTTPALCLEIALVSMLDHALLKHCPRNTLDK